MERGRGREKRKGRRERMGGRKGGKQKGKKRGEGGREEVRCSQCFPRAWLFRLGSGHFRDLTFIPHTRLYLSPKLS